jgi:HEAT repeat protein
MIPLDDQQVNTCLHQLYDDDQEIRINAINQLGESGDELCLKELREKLKFISREHQALIIAVGKLKKELGIK